jgi:hypothetical protein
MITGSRSVGSDPARILGLKNLALRHLHVVYKRRRPGPVRRWISLFVWAERLGGQEQGGWVLYRIVNDSSHE